RTILTPKGILFTDEALTQRNHIERHIDRLSSADEHRNERTGLSRIAGTNNFVLEVGGRGEIQIKEPVVVLCSDESENYGSFLFRVLPKIIFCHQFCREVKILAPAKYENMLELLQIAGLPRDRIIKHDDHVIYKLDHAIVPSIRN